MSDVPMVDLLVRHQARRLGGVPTVGALVGPVGLGVRAWRGWCGERPCVVTSADQFVTRWVETLFAAFPPQAAACGWLAVAAGRAVGAVAADLERMTRFDLDQLTRVLGIDPRRPGAAAALLVLRDRLAGTATTAARFVAESAGAGTAAERAARVVRAVAELYPPEAWPALLVTPPADTGPDWALSAARALEHVAAAEPRLPVALALTAEEYARLASRSDLRAVALLREGFVELRGVTGNQLEERFRNAGVAPPPPAVRDRLADTGLADDVAAAFVAAARAVHAPPAGGAASDFRSVHEELLYGLLESMPETAGLFRPNRPLGFRHGHKPAEADLVAESLKLVVEVDGGHYHLTPDQYRRDRRKDWLYQRHGYAVLRFLAEDVASDPGPTLDSILEAVAFRRSLLLPTSTGEL